MSDIKVGRIEQLTHTKGPWDDASKYPYVDTVRIFAGTHYVASVGNSDDTREQTEANARLIAAAPDLLAALKACRDVVYRDPNAPSNLAAICDVAIAKAEGGAK